MRDKDLLKLEYHKVKEVLKKKVRSQATAKKIESLKPSPDPEEVRREVEKTKAFFKVAPRVKLYPFEDVEEILKRSRLEGAVLSVEEVLKVLRVAEAVKELKRSLSESAGGEEALRPLLKRLYAFGALESAIKASIDPRGFVRDEASEELLRLRRSIRKLEEEIKKRLESLINRPDADKFLSDRIITIRNGRYVIPVKTSQAKKIFGIVHGTSSSGYTTYIEPQFVVHLNNRLTELKSEEEEEIRRVLRRLTELVGDYAKELEDSFRALVEADLLMAKYLFAREVGASFPEEGKKVELYRVKHPLLVYLKEEVVPVDLLLTEKRGLILTGPNTGGKTVALKTLGLCALLYQSAIPFPVGEGSKMPVFKKVFVDVGDEQSIEQSLSTFSAHVQNIAQFIKEADGETLVLLDELGAGTDPVEGSALGIGILEYLKKRGAWVFATTHHTPIKLYAATSDYYVPASVLFDRETLKPLYRIAYNTVGESMAFYVAKKLGMPEEVIEIAKSQMGEAGEKYMEAMERLSRMAEQYEEEKKKLEELKESLKKEKEETERLRREMEEAKRKAWREVYKEAKRYLKELSAKAEELLRKPEEREKVERFLKEKEKELKEKAPPPAQVKEGDRVEFMGKVGVVLKKKDGKAFVAFDRMKAWVDLEELKPAEKAEGESAPVPQLCGERSASRKDLLNLMGKDAESALLELERFIEEASSAGLESVKIVHGIGSGRLRQAVREFLSKSDKVRFFRDAYPKEGGSGVTVVYLKGGEE